MEQPIYCGCCSWENNWEDLAIFFDYPGEIRRMISTTNTYRRLQSPAPQGNEIQSIFPNSRGGSHVAFSGQLRHHQEVDHAHLQLAIYPQPTCHSLL
jgi:transposase-like protein